MKRAIDTKLSVVVFCWTMVLVFPWWIHLGGLATILMMVRFHPRWLPFDATARRAFFRFLRFAVILSIVVIAANALLMREGRALAIPLPIPLYEGGLMFGVRTIARLLLLTFSILAFFASTRLRDVAAYLDRAGLPDALVSVLLLSLYFLEHLPSRIGQIFTAQEARGLPVRAGLMQRAQALVGLLSPLVLSSVVESIDRGIALDLRGYHLRVRKLDTGSQQEPFSPAGIFLLLLSGLILFAKAFTWLLL